MIAALLSSLSIKRVSVELFPISTRELASRQTRGGPRASQLFQRLLSNIHAGIADDTIPSTCRHHARLPQPRFYCNTPPPAKADGQAIAKARARVRALSLLKAERRSLTAPTTRTATQKDGGNSNAAGGSGGKAAG